MNKNEPMASLGRLMPHVAAALLTLAACGPSPDEAAEVEVEYEAITTDDVDLGFEIVQQHYLVVWNVAWSLDPEVDRTLMLEPESEWLVTYETTAPDVPGFTGETYSFTIEADNNGTATVTGEGLDVTDHPINAHPDKLVPVVTGVTQQ